MALIEDRMAWSFISSSLLRLLAVGDIDERDDKLVVGKFSCRDQHPAFSLDL